MKLHLINETVQDLVQKIADRESMSPDAVLMIVSDYSVDPKFRQFVIRQWAKENIRLPEDGPRVQNTLESFKIVRPRLQNKDLLSYKTLHDLETAIEPHIGHTTRSGESSLDPTKLPGVKLVGSNDKYRCFEIEDVESLKKMGEGTKWCTRGSYGEHCMAADYIAEDGLVFQIWEGNKPIIQFTASFDQIMDVNDNDIDISGFLDILPKFPLEWMEELNGPAVDSGDFTGPFEEPIQTCNNFMFKVYKRKNEEYEKLIVKFNQYGPMKRYIYMLDERVPLLEPYIVERAPGFIVKYANKFGRIEEFENNIAKWAYPNDIWQYYKDVYLLFSGISRWPALEEELYVLFSTDLLESKGDGYHAQLIIMICDYCLYNHIRLRELEPHMIETMRDDYLYKYFVLVVRRPWPELEEHYRQNDNQRFLAFMAENNKNQHYGPSALQASNNWWIKQ